MPDIHLSLEINRPPEIVFNLLADIASYSRWLPPSKDYSETVDISESPVKQGTTYLDKNPNNVLFGEVTEYQPYSCIVFRQATEKPSLNVTIRYDLASVANGTRLERTTSLATSGMFRLLQPIVVRRVRQENQRTLAALKIYLEAEAH